MNKLNGYSLHRASDAKRAGDLTTVNKPKRDSVQCTLSLLGCCKTARVLAHQRRVDGRLGRIVWCVHNTTLYRAAPEHLQPATARETCFHVTSANLLARQFQQVLQQGHCWIKTGHHQKRWGDQKDTSLMTKRPKKVNIHQNECDIDRNRIRQRQPLTPNTTRIRSRIKMKMITRCGKSSTDDRNSSGIKNDRVLRSSCLTARPWLQECPA